MGPTTRSAHATSSKVTLDTINGNGGSENGSPLTELSERESRQPIEGEDKVGEGIVAIEVLYV
jgi:hypothetical protein